MKVTINLNEIQKIGAYVTIHPGQHAYWTIRDSSGRVINYERIPQDNPNNLRFTKHPARKVKAFHFHSEA